MSLTNKPTINDLTSKTIEISTNTDNFIPTGTIYTVELDGSGDFETIQDAINYLSGKYSNGYITIKLGEGTFTTNTININLDSSNIPKLCFEGSGINKTTISVPNVSDPGYMLAVSHGTVTIRNIKFVGNSSNNPRGLVSCDNGVLNLSNIHIDKCGIFATAASHAGHTYLQDSLTFTNCANAIGAESGGVIDVRWGTNITATNITGNLFFANGCGRITVAYPNITQNNVNNYSSPAINKISGQGYVLVNT